MESTIRLFRSQQNNEWITDEDLLRSLESIKAYDCETLFMHSSLSFGFPNPELSREQIVEALYKVIAKLNVANLIVPTFTFSFCNNTFYDINKSRSRMGVLNEYIRKHPSSIRSVDPLMSVSIIGNSRELVENIGKFSVGRNSTFDMLHNRKNVKFLFFGTRLGDCFTYMHYIEEVLNVPYRYNRQFTGTIITPEKTYEDTYTLFVRYKNVKAGNGSYTYEQLLYEREISKRVVVGDSTITVVDEQPAFDVYKELIGNDVYYFIDKSSILDGDTSFQVANMVAL